MNTDEQIRAAYALNLMTVSISQIVEYNDAYILEQEYDTILSNLNLERIPKDEALLEICMETLDEITYQKMEAGDKKLLERKYQHQLKNAVWTAVPNVGAIFATENPGAMVATLATQVGIGYMNYRRNKAEYDLGYEESKWKIQKNRLQHLNGIRKKLFETAWRLADKYGFPDEYRLTEKQISLYNEALMERNLIIRYNKLDAMRYNFNAYPAFWYQIGSTANSIYRSDIFKDDAEIQGVYKSYAMECFEKYKKINTFNLLRHDTLTSAWALEYLELLDMSYSNHQVEAKKLIEAAEKNSGEALDVLELCAFAYLRIQDEENAVRIFHFLVNKQYNIAINTQILSGLYIKKMRDNDPITAFAARVGYKQLPSITDPKYVLNIPPEEVDLSQWKPSWNREESFDELLERREAETAAKKIKDEEARKRARAFYQNPIVLVYKKEFEEVTEYFLGVINENKMKIDTHLPPPSRLELGEYKKKREELERKGSHIIFVGDSDEAKMFYKNAKNGRWDYYNLGMRFLSYGNKTVLLARTLKDDQITDLCKLAGEVNKEIHIPSGVASVQYSFLKEIYAGKFDDLETGVATVLVTLVAFPILVLGQELENIKNRIQIFKNFGARKKLEFLQYCIAIYKYLESEGAVVDKN